MCRPRHEVKRERNTAHRDSWLGHAVVGAEDGAVLDTVLGGDVEEQLVPGLLDVAEIVLPRKNKGRGGGWERGMGAVVCYNSTLPLLLLLL